MKIILEEEFFEEPDEELGAMIAPPLIGIVPSPKTETAHAILVQLEKDIQRQAQVNNTKAPIEKNLISHFKKFKTKQLKYNERKRGRRNDTQSFSKA